VSYNYTAASTAIYANRLVLENQSRYYFKQKINYAFADIRYDRNQFDGYYYHLAEIVGEGNIIHIDKSMSINYQGGVGALEDQPIGLKYKTSPAARLAVDYQWHLTRHATFKEAVTALLSTANNNTYESVTSLQTGLYGNFKLQLSYTATYNEFPVISYYKKLNTITSADLMYKF
jgi:putative salt-induced outer membrane protein